MRFSPIVLLLFGMLSDESAVQALKPPAIAAKPVETQEQAIAAIKKLGVELGDVCQPNGDELSEQGRQQRSPFQDFLVEVCALLAGETAHGDEQGAVLGLGECQSFAEVGPPHDLGKRFGDCSLGWAEDLQPRLPGILPRCGERASHGCD